MRVPIVGQVAKLKNHLGSVSRRDPTPGQSLIMHA
jgi:hypothetical protein